MDRCAQTTASLTSIVLQRATSGIDRVKTSTGVTLRATFWRSATRNKGASCDHRVGC
jgi:hypothetical protein